MREETTKEIDMTIDINLHGYGPYKIIQFIEEGILSIKEVEDSGIAHCHFTNILSDYLQVAKHNSMDETMIDGECYG